MPRKQIIFLIFAALIAIGTVLAARSLLQPDEPAPVAVDTSAEPAAAPVEVLVAKKDLPAGSFLAAEDVEWKNWPADSVTDGMLKKGVAEEKTYAGAVVRTGLRTGEPIIGGRILKSDEHGFLAAVLLPGMRAMTVKISPVSGVAGFIFPNDQVDVILAHEVQRTDDTRMVDRRVSETVLENVRVVALDQKTNDQTNEPKVAELATLEVTPKQAEKLALVSQMGTLSLVLRSLSSNVAANVSPVMQTNAKPAAQPVADGKAETSTGLAPQLLEAAQRAMPLGAGKPLPSRHVTWDSDVSLALPPPSDRAQTEHTVQIYRGSTASDITFGARPK